MEPPSERHGGRAAATEHRADGGPRDGDWHSSRLDQQRRAVHRVDERTTRRIQTTHDGADSLHSRSFMSVFTRCDYIGRLP